MPLSQAPTGVLDRPGVNLCIPQSACTRGWLRPLPDTELGPHELRQGVASAAPRRTARTRAHRSFPASRHDEDGASATIPGELDAACRGVGLHAARSADALREDRS